MALVTSTSLISLVEYLDAAPEERGAVTRALCRRHETAYHPDFDPWQCLGDAVLRDRKIGRNGSAVRAAAAKAPESSRKPLLLAAADAWAELCWRWLIDTPFHVEPTCIELGGLRVKVAPMFAEQAFGGRVEVVVASFAEKELGSHVVGALLRIMQRCYPEHDVAFVDVHRRRVASTRDVQNLSVYDAYLESEAAGLAHLLAGAA